MRCRLLSVGLWAGRKPPVPCVHPQGGRRMRARRVCNRYAIGYRLGIVLWYSKLTKLCFSRLTRMSLRASPQTGVAIRSP